MHLMLTVRQTFQHDTENNTVCFPYHYVSLLLVTYAKKTKNLTMITHTKIKLTFAILHSTRSTNIIT